MTAIILDSEDLLTVNQAAAQLHKRPKTIRNWISLGQIGSKKVGGHRLIPAREVREILDAAPTTERIS